MSLEQVRASEPRDEFAIRPETDDPPLAEILALDDAEFRTRFRGTPIKRTGRDRFVRNALIAAGNARDSSLVPHVEALIDDASPLVRAMAAWALQRLDPAKSDTLRAERLAAETDGAVRAEWQVTEGALVP